MQRRRPAWGLGNKRSECRLDVQRVRSEIVNVVKRAQQVIRHTHKQIVWFNSNLVFTSAKGMYLLWCGFPQRNSHRSSSDPNERYFLTVGQREKSVTKIPGHFLILHLYKIVEGLYIHCSLQVRLSVSEKIPSDQLHGFDCDFCCHDREVSAISRCFLYH